MVQFKQEDYMSTSFGIDRIAEAFTRANQRRVAALMPYFTLGFPDAETSIAVIQAIASHCDLLELGVPFSDPIADGPSIQRSTQLALENGTSTADCLEMLRRLRRRGVQTPILLMGYYNPILAYGEAAYVRDAAAAGADGFIIPDLPVEESESLEELAASVGLAVIHFLAPTSNPSRVEVVVHRARAFIYLVSLTGVTGARQQLQGDLRPFVDRVRGQTKIPLAVGFGISNPEQAAAVGSMADGVIVGSALINAVDAAKDKPAAAVEFVRKLGGALARK